MAEIGLPEGDILLLQKLVESCLNQYVELDRIAGKLSDEYGIRPLFTEFVLQKLLHVNPEFFRWYHLMVNKRLRQRIQIAAAASRYEDAVQAGPSMMPLRNSHHPAVRSGPYVAAAVASRYPPMQGRVSMIPENSHSAVCSGPQNVYSVGQVVNNGESPSHNTGEAKVSCYVGSTQARASMEPVNSHPDIHYNPHYYVPNIGGPSVVAYSVGASMRREHSHTDVHSSPLPSNNGDPSVVANMNSTTNSVAGETVINGKSQPVNVHIGVEMFNNGGSSSCPNTVGFSGNFANAFDPNGYLEEDADSKTHSMKGSGENVGDVSVEGFPQPVDKELDYDELLIDKNSDYLGGADRRLLK